MTPCARIIHAETEEVSKAHDTQQKKERTFAEVHFQRKAFIAVDLIKKRCIKSTFHEQSNGTSTAIPIATIYPIGEGESGIVSDLVFQSGSGDHNNVRPTA